MSEQISVAELSDIGFDPLRRMVLAEAEEHQMQVARNDSAGIVVQTVYGRIAFSPQGAGCRAEVAAPRTDFLQTLKDSLVAHIAELAPEAAEGLRWVGDRQQGALPANAGLMQVAGAETLDCGFVRITLTGDASRFSDDAIHFRLGLPPEGRAPVWPRIGANGATVWPKGEDALHLPVYTARRAEAGRLVFDLYEHAGGRTTDWASTDPVGAQVLITGPGGGGARIEGPVLGYADDTAFPAVARILAANPDLTGTIHLYPSSAQTARYSFPAHPGVALVWHQARDAARMARTACDELDTERFVWFAGERHQADVVRKAWKQAGGAARRSYIAAYWQDAALR